MSGSRSWCPVTKKSECFLKVLKGQGPHSWMEASRVPVQQLEIPGISGHTNPLGNSSETPHGGKQPNSPPVHYPSRDSAIAEKQPEAGHTHSKGASSILAGQDTENQSTCNCPTQATRGRSCPSKERPGASGKSWLSQLTDKSIAHHCTYQHEKAKKI